MQISTKHLRSRYCTEKVLFTIQYVSCCDIINTEDGVPELDGAEEGRGDGPLGQYVDGHDQLRHHVAHRVQSVRPS